MKYLFFLHLFIPVIILSQTFENLELVLEIPDPDTGSGSWGTILASGNLNSDTFNDILIVRSVWDRSKIFIFYGGPEINNEPDFYFTAPVGLSGWIFDVATGDINDDGFCDVIAGAPISKIYLGCVEIDSLPNILIPKPEEAVEFGSSVACGDLNNDGYDDYIVGAYGTNNYVGRVYIYFGGSSPDTIPDFILNGDPDARNNFGARLASGRDVNNDGYKDLFVAGNWGLGTLAACYIYYGGDPMDTIPDVTMHPLQGGFFGDAITLIPDLENDGYDDAGVGIPDDNPDKDKTFGYFGGDPMDNVLDLLFYEGTGGKFGYSLGGCFSETDVYGDVFIGAPGKGETYGGITYLYRGSPIMDTLYDAKIIGSNDQNIGWSVASAGDIDGDGMDEIMVSNYAAVYAPRKVWVVRYTPTGIEEDETDSTIIRLIKTYPNPFNNCTKIEYQIGCYTSVSLKVYDVSGRLIKTLIDCRQNPGLYRVRWDGKDNKNAIVSAGIYFCELKVEKLKGQKVKRSKKLVFLGN